MDDLGASGASTRSRYYRIDFSYDTHLEDMWGHSLYFNRRRPGESPCWFDGNGVNEAGHHRLIRLVGSAMQDEKVQENIVLIVFRDLRAFARRGSRLGKH